MTIVLCWFLFSLFQGVALHNIHAFHSRIVFVSSFQIFLKQKKKKQKNKKQKKQKTKNKKKRKRKQNVFCIIFLDLKSRLANLFLHNMFMYFV